jgi:phosphotransferase system HPr-like phosphotransfer protein
MAEDNTPTNVVDDFKTIQLQITDSNGLHTRPATQLLQDVYAVGNKYGVDYPFIMKNGNLIEGSLQTLLKENIKFGETLTIYMPKNIPDIKFNESKNYYKPINIPDTPDRSFGPGAAHIDEILNANTQLVNELPLSQTVKNQFDNFLRTRARNLATPGGAIDAVDIWELGVTGLMITAIAYKEFDEIPTIFKRTATNMFNSMTASYNIPPVPLEEYDLDYEFINKVLTTGEKVMPTDIIIKKVGDVVKGAAETGAVTGFGYVPPNLTKTDTMETTQKIQPGVQEEKMFEQARPKKSSGAGSGVKIL